MQGGKPKDRFHFHINKKDRMNWGWNPLVSPSSDHYIQIYAYFYPRVRLPLEQCQYHRFEMYLGSKNHTDTSADVPGIRKVNSVK